MSAIRQVLRQILERRGLTYPDGRALYAYRLNAAELSILEDAVRSRLRFGGSWSRHDAAGICLMAAERFCRAHAGGPWKWETAGLAPDEVHGQRDILADAIRNTWRRELIRTTSGRRFILTLAREGGLPRRLLADNQSIIGHLLRAALTDRESLPTSVRTYELVGEHMAQLPASLRTDDVVQGLLSDLVDAVHKLRRSVPEVVEAEDPLSVLNARLPNWRYDLPLNMEDERASRLVSGLVAQLSVPSNSAPFDFAVRLLQSRQGWRIDRQLRLPQRVEADSLSRHFGIVGDLPGRTQLLLRTSDGLSAGVADLRLSGTAEVVRVHSLRRPTIPPHARAWFELVAASTRKWECHPAGGEALGDGPWVFPDRDDADWLGEGSLQTRADTVRVALPSGATLRVEGELQHLGSLGAAGELRKVVQLRGTLWVTTSGMADDAAFRIRTARPGGRESYHIEATCFTQLGSWGSEVMHGQPRAYALSSQTSDANAPSVRRDIAEEAIQMTRVGDIRGWSSPRPDLLGDLWVRVVEDGVLRLQRRVLRVPEGFHAEVTPLPGQGSGRVRLQGIGLDQVEVERVEGLVAKKHKEANGIRIDINCSEEAPVRVRLRLDFSNTPAFWVQVPFPARSLSIVGLDGTAVAPTDLVAVDRLLGLRAQATDPDYRARFMLLGRAGDMGWTVLHELRNEQSGWHSLPLVEVEDRLRLMLARAGHMDTEVKLALERLGGRRTPVLLRVAQYPRKLEPVRSVPLQVPLGLRLGQDDHETALRVELRPIGRPAAPAFLAEPYEDGWRWPTAAGQGKWLATCWEQDAGEPTVGARPLLITIIDDGVEPSVTAVPETLAAALDEPDQESRVESLTQVFNKMAGNADHPCWNLLQEHIDTLGTLPAPTFDVVVTLARHPDAVALAAIKQAATARLRGFATAMESLPFAWWLVPFSSWKRALFAHQRSVVGLAERFDFIDANKELHRMVKELMAQGGALETAARWLDHLLTPDSSVWAFLGDAAPTSLTAVYASFVRESVDRTWPSFTQPDAPCSWLHNLEFSKRDFEDLCVATFNGTHRDVVAAPVVAAWAAVRGAPLSAEQLIELRRLRAFEPEWFDYAWSMTSVRLWSRPAYRPLFGEETS